MRSMPTCSSVQRPVTPNWKFHGMPQIGKPRSLWQRIRNPQSGLVGLAGVVALLCQCTGWLFTIGQKVFVRLKTRSENTSDHLEDGLRKRKVIGKLPVMLGQTVVRAEAQASRVRLQLRASWDGGECEIVTDHIIAATGYKVDLERG